MLMAWRLADVFGRLSLPLSLLNLCFLGYSMDSIQEREIYCKATWG